MAKKPTNTTFTHKCAACGRPLPLNDAGIPVTSLWKDDHYLCPDCKFKPTTAK